MRVFILRSPAARSPLARLAFGLVFLLALVGLALVLLPLIGIAFVVAVAGVIVLTLAGLVARFLMGKRLRQMAEAQAAAAGAPRGAPGPWRGRMQDVEDVQVVEVPRELPRR